ncbi:MAG TPA: hypothetical protein VK395_33155 [Gemmataceae bacterium]|nr:hypothetical protein [Gemmataceae bacterium]
MAFISKCSKTLLRRLVPYLKSFVTAASFFLDLDTLEVPCHASGDCCKERVDLIDRPLSHYLNIASGQVTNKTCH